MFQVLQCDSEVALIIVRHKLLDNFADPERYK